MKKTNTIIIVTTIATIIIGIIFWQFLGQNDQNNSTDNTISTEQIAVQDNIVEIFYLPHPPAEAIVQEIESILEIYPEYEIKKYSFEDPASEEKINNYNLIDHSPVAIFVGGINTFTLDGRNIVLLNFPQGDAFIPSLEGSWGYEDVKKILADPNKYKND